MLGNAFSKSKFKKKEKKCKLFDVKKFTVNLLFYPAHGMLKARGMFLLTIYIHALLWNKWWIFQYLYIRVPCHDTLVVQLLFYCFCKKTATNWFEMIKLKTNSSQFFLLKLFSRLSCYSSNTKWLYNCCWVLVQLPVCRGFQGLLYLWTISGRVIIQI